MKILLPIINKLKARKHFSLRENPSYARAEKIGILLIQKAGEESYAANNLVQKIMEDGKSVSTLIMTQKPLSKETTETNHFTEKDISFWGNWKQKNVQEFYENKFDFLIYPELTILPIIENILLSSQAKCRVGFFLEESSHLFELMIKPVNNPHSKEKLQEIYQCLIKLK